MSSQPKVWAEVHFGEPDAAAHYKIRQITNLIPVEFDFEENGERRVVLGHMDYATNSIRLPQTEFLDEGMLREAIMEFLMKRNAQAVAKMTTPQTPNLSGYREHAAEIKEGVKKTEAYLKDRVDKQREAEKSTSPKQEGSNGTDQP